MSDAAGRHDHVAQSLGRLRFALDMSFSRVSRSLDLTPQQGQLLCAALAPTSVGAVAESMGCDRSNVSRMVDRATARGWVRREADAADARVSLIALTPQGRRLAESLVAGLVEETTDLVSGWTPRQIDSAVRLLDSVSEALGS